MEFGILFPVKCDYYLTHHMANMYQVNVMQHYRWSYPLSLLLGLTQEALAEKSELTTQFVSYAEAGKRGMRPENLMKVAAALGVSTDYLLTGDIIDKDKLLLSEKLDKLTPQQVRIVENIIDECIALYGSNK